MFPVSLDIYDPVSPPGYKEIARAKLNLSMQVIVGSSPIVMGYVFQLLEL